MGRKKTPKSIVLNEKGQIIRHCPKCRSTRLVRAEGKGFYCKRCSFTNKRRLTSNPKEVGKVSFHVYTSKR